MRPKWPKLASLSQEICTLSFSYLVQSLLPKDTLLRTYYLCLFCLHIIKMKINLNTNQGYWDLDNEYTQADQSS